MKKLLWIWIGLAAFGPPALAVEAPWRITAEASVYQPGTTAVIHFQPSDQEQPLDLVGLRQKTHFYPADEVCSSYWALLAVPLDTPAGPQSLHVYWRDAGGLRQQVFPIQVGPSHYPKESLTVSNFGEPVLASLKPEAKLQRQAIRRSAAAPLWKGLFHLPLAAFKRISSVFGLCRVYNGGEGTWQHKGVDLAADAGTRVLAANRGRVVLARMLKAHGGTVILDHGGGLATYYFHMSKVLVRRGQTVGRGQVLGRVGSLGISTGPHLHWQVMVNGFPVDPMQWVRPAQVSKAKTQG